MILNQKHHKNLLFIDFFSISSIHGCGPFLLTEGPAELSSLEPVTQDQDEGATEAEDNARIAEPKASSEKPSQKPAKSDSPENAPEDDLPEKNEDSDRSAPEEAEFAGTKKPEATSKPERKNSGESASSEAELGGTAKRKASLKPAENKGSSEPETPKKGKTSQQPGHDTPTLQLRKPPTSMIQLRKASTAKLWEMQTDLETRFEQEGLPHEIIQSGFEVLETRWRSDESKCFGETLEQKGWEAATKRFMMI